MPSEWPDLLELARHGEEVGLRAAVRSCCTALLAERPLPRASEPYGRRLLHQGERGEVMLAGWPRGNRSAPHDHGGAAGLVLVLAGRFSETRYAFDGSELRPVNRRQFAHFDLVRAPHGTIHDMQAEEESTSLHLYWPEICDMRVYDSTRRMTFVVTGESGAWFPRHDERLENGVDWDASPLAPPVST